MQVHTASQVLDLATTSSSNQLTVLLSDGKQAALQMQESKSSTAEKAVTQVTATLLHCSAALEVWRLTHWYNCSVVFAFDESF